ncbi:SoxR reducing system RseC family protein [Marinobacter lacisalsi]|uniref:SoxR reducing system RseC family protein n=1 Tax=Marinobacter lacisalsi TaxID=475979 RepID=A0ABV8QGZ0_9GAMM
MIHETGTVISISGNEAWVQTIRESACQTCKARHGCGQKALAGMTSGQSRQIRVVNTLGARPGDQVTVAIEESALLRASLLVYALPLLLMVVATALVGAILPGRDGMAIISAVMGLGVGLWLARWYSIRDAGRWQPVMGRLIPVGAELSD